MLQLFSQETDLLMKVIMKCVNIKFWDILSCFHYILNAPRIFIKIYVHYLFTIEPEQIFSFPTGQDPCMVTCEVLITLVL